MINQEREYTWFWHGEMKKHEWFVFINIFLLFTHMKKNKNKNEEKRFPEVLVRFVVEKKTYYDCVAHSLVHWNRDLHHTRLHLETNEKLSFYCYSPQWITTTFSTKYSYSSILNTEAHFFNPKLQINRPWQLHNYRCEQTNK